MRLWLINSYVCRTYVWLYFISSILYYMTLCLVLHQALSKVRHLYALWIKCIFFFHFHSEKAYSSHWAIYRFFVLIEYSLIVWVTLNLPHMPSQFDGTTFHQKSRWPVDNECNAICANISIDKTLALQLIDNSLEFSW